MCGLSETPVLVSIDRQDDCLAIDGMPSRIGTLTFIDPIVATERPPRRRATRQSIADCLVKWNVGTQHYSEPKSAFSQGYVVNTSTFWHIYETWETLSDFWLYCRCARVLATNRGLLFAQNIRMNASKGNGNHCSYMPDDNLKELTARLRVREELYRPDACTFTGPAAHPWKEVYWSLKEFEESMIVLNGCDGQDYTYKDPAESETHLEYFES